MHKKTTLTWYEVGFKYYRKLSLVKKFRIYFLLVDREKRCASAYFENSNVYASWEHMAFVAGLRIVESQSASVTYRRESVVVEEKREYRIPLVN